MVGTYQADNETVANVAEGIFTGGSVVLGEAHLEVGHGCETRDLTYGRVSYHAPIGLEIQSLERGKYVAQAYQ